uniref:MIF4G_like_2 domain-containing protein n=1 Tax=Schistocephalus solidus TaxID=70667 RepID=A0A183TMB5_SCHSO
LGKILPYQVPFNHLILIGTAPRKLKAFNRVFEAFRDRRSPESLLDLIKRLTSRDGQDGSGEEEDPDEDSDAHSSRRSSSRHSSRSSSALERDKEEEEEEVKDRLKRRPHITASRRNPAGGRRSEARDGGRDDEDAEVVGVNDEASSITVDPLLRSGASVGRNASPPLLDDAGFVAAPGTAMLAAGSDATTGGTSGVGGGASRQLCVVPSVTSRPLELFMTALLYRAHKTISHTCSLLKRLHVWECLLHTLIRVGRRVAQINPKLEAAKESLEIQRHKSDSESSESEDEEDRGGRSKSISLRRDRDPGGHRRGRSRSSDESADGHERDSRRSVAVADKVASLEQERCEAVRSQCAVITLLLHRHVRLIDSVEEAAEEAAASGASAVEREAAGDMSSEELGFVSYWLKGRLMQTVLEHQDQLLPYMENLEALMSDVCPFVQEVFQSLRSLYA